MCYDWKKPFLRKPKLSGNVRMNIVKMLNIMHSIFFISHADDF